eukprot:NODE_178_length_15814_cov_0.338657.p2 type:complete len:667 gc:universal NODE_178_length_15814_cov_0.338657:12470-14470(+)
MNNNSRFDASVKNKSVAEYQITAEHLIREAFDNQIKLPFLDHKIKDEDEFDHLIFMKRRFFEDGLRRSKTHIGLWMNYATFELQLKNYDRARSIFERALDIDYRNTRIWTKYIEMEISNKQFNYARNLYERVVSLLPKVDQFWLKYIQLQVNQKQFKSVMELYNRWIDNKPEPYVYGKACQYFTRGKHYDLARNVLFKLVDNYPIPESWRRLSEFEERNSSAASARGVYEKALQFYKNDPPHSILIFFAKFEQRCKQLERCREIYKYALTKYKDDPSISKQISQSFQQFELQIGDPSGITTAITLEKSHMFEQKLLVKNDVDIWLEYLAMEESLLQDQLDNFPEYDKIHELNDVNMKKRVERIIQLYNRALDIQPEPEKPKWKRFSFIWIKFLLFLELTCKDTESTKEAIIRCLDAISNRTFTISKLWNHAALFYIRCHLVDKARITFQNALRNLPTSRIYRYYIEMELGLQNIDNARYLYESMIISFPNNINAYIEYSTFELELDNIERARSVLEIGLTQRVDKLLLFKTMIELEQALGNLDKVFDLYEKLLQHYATPEVWSMYSQFSSIINVEKGREIFKRGYDDFEQRELVEDRILLLEYWKQYEMMHGDTEHVDKVIGMLPKLVKTKTPLGEKYEYIFPDSGQNKQSLKLLEMAKNWKMGNK